MARDEKTRFAHQKDLHEKRPEVDPESIKAAAETGDCPAMESFNLRRSRRACIDRRASSRIASAYET
jgi:hypothetical protein